MVLLSTIVAPPVPYPGPPGTDLAAWSPNRHTWTGWNGASWDLTTGESGVWLAPGLRGEEHAAETHFWLDSPAVSGATWNGSRTEKRDVFWPVAVRHVEGSRAWLDHNQQLWRTWHPRHRGTWSVTQPGANGVDGETRSLPLRFVSVDFQPDIDPALIGWAQYGLTFVAEQPFWRGTMLSQNWGQATAAANFFGGGSPTGPGFGPPFVIGPGANMANSTATNPGDVDAWPVWTIYGPCTTATVGLGDLLIHVPIALSAGQWVQIDTDPTMQTAFRGSGAVNLVGAVDVTYLLGDVAFSAIPAGDTVALSVAMTGTGRVGMDLTPLYYSAY